MDGMSARLTTAWPVVSAAATVAVLLGFGVCGQARGADQAGAGEAATTQEATSQPASPPATTRPATTRPAGATSRPAGAGKGDFWRKDGGGAGTMWKLLAYVVVILVLGAGALVVTRKFLPRLRIAGGREMSVVETAHLAPRVTLHLVEAGGKRFMVGATRERVSMLAEIGTKFPDIADVAREMGRADAADPMISEGDE